jgi:hypothetical protein
MAKLGELEVVTPRADGMDAFQKLASREMRQIPVVQNGNWAGCSGVEIFCAGYKCNPKWWVVELQT